MLADACRCLGLQPNAKNGSFQTHARRLDADEVRTINLPNNEPTLKKRRWNIISRPGLFKLIQRSNKPEAKEFDRWVRHEVLPDITLVLPTPDKSGHVPAWTAHSTYPHWQTVSLLKVGT